MKLSSKALACGQSPMRKFHPYAVAAAAAGKKIYHLNIGQPDIHTPDALYDAIHNFRTPVLAYAASPGIPELISAIEGYYRNIGVQLSESDILVTTGGSEALQIAANCLLDDGDEVIVPEPFYPNYHTFITTAGGVIHPLHTRPEEGYFYADRARIEACITPKTKALMINTPNNPTGSVMDEETMRQIAEIAVKHDILVISDDVYNTLLYDGAKNTCIAAFPGMKERTAVVNSLSKSYAMTGWRIGFVAGPAELVSAMTKCQENFNACANAPGQYAGTVALAHPELCEELRKVFENRRRLLLDGLKGIKGIESNDPKGAFYVFADISSFGLSSADFCNRLLDEQKVVCIPGSAFGACGEGFIRIAYTCSDSDLVEAVARIKTFCESL